MEGIILMKMMELVESTWGQVSLLEVWSQNEVNCHIKQYLVTKVEGARSSTTVVEP